jgi:hypothetical protein
VGANYELRLKAYDLKSGEVLGSVQFFNRHYNHDYQMFPIFDNKAWGYSDKTGLQLLDLAKPAIIADQEEIFRLNPQLGEKISFNFYGEEYDPLTNGLHVLAEDGRVYRIDTDLKAAAVDRVPNRDAYGANVWAYRKDWDRYYLKHSLGYHVHTKGAKCSADSVTLLEPEFIAEYNPEARSKKRVWVTHKSAIFGEYDYFLSFVDGSGEELNRIDLREVFNKDKDPKVLATYTDDDEVLIFIGIGDTHAATIKGYSLTALRTDLETGQVRGRIDYF